LGRQFSGSFSHSTSIPESADEPLKEGGVVKDGGAEYVVVRVIQTSRTTGLGHAWAELA